jgi:hypothetical protein
MEQWEASYQYYELHNYTSTALTFTNGYANNINLKYTLSRNSVDDPTYPKSGSQITWSAQSTPPYSIINQMLGNQINYADETEQQKFKWLEYYKIKFTTSWYLRLAGKLVLYTKLGYGWLGYFNAQKGLTPFERFYLGGSGLTGYNPMDGVKLFQCADTIMVQFMLIILLLIQQIRVHLPLQNIRWNFVIRSRLIQVQLFSDSYLRMQEIRGEALKSSIHLM